MGVTLDCPSDDVYDMGVVRKAMGSAETKGWWEMKTTFYVRTGLGDVTRDGGFTDVAGVANRAVVQRAGWQKVRYGGRWYQLLGGIRTPLCINLLRPLPVKVKGA